jgi:hypothetical protein
MGNSSLSGKWKLASSMQAAAEPDQHGPLVLEESADSTSSRAMENASGLDTV